MTVVGFGRGVGLGRGQEVELENDTGDRGKLPIMFYLKGFIYKYDQILITVNSVILCINKSKFSPLAIVPSCFTSILSQQAQIIYCLKPEFNFITYCLSPVFTYSLLHNNLKI